VQRRRNETEIKLRREIEEAEQSKQGSGDEKSVWKLSPGDIVLGKELGRGAFGEIPPAFALKGRRRRRRRKRRRKLT